jgi:8-oxo-(d)GTP phosphatase
LSKSQDKTLVIIRHAHRDKDKGGREDNGLSKKGKRQAQEIAKYFKKKFSDEEKPSIFSSPKLRCVETVEPIAEETKTRIMTSPLLDESEEESPEKFDKRMQDFLDLWSASEAPLTIACSHGDCIPVMLQKISGNELDLKKGGWAEITLEKNGKPKLKKVIQDFD